MTYQERRIPRFSRIAGALRAAVLLLLVQPVSAAEPVEVKVLHDQDPIIVRYDFETFSRQTVTIEGREFLCLDLPGEAGCLERGFPGLPRVCRSVLIPECAAMGLEVLDSTWYSIEGHVAPSKGVISMAVDPASVPNTFNSVYGEDAWYPSEPAILGDPYIMRDARGVVVTVRPVRYNPVRGIIEICTQMTVRIAPVGQGRLNVLPAAAQEKPCRAFEQLFETHFLNYAGGRYTPLDEDGELLIITYDAWNANVQPLKTWKDSAGITTTIVNVSTIGNNATSIKSYIQSVYDTSNLAFVLLVGDAAQVATPYTTSGAADPTYSQLAGSDPYPDIMVGRFSAENAAQVDTQVERTVEYEMEDHSDFWFWKGTGVSMETNPDGDAGRPASHMNYVRYLLLEYGYISVDQIYDPGATASEVSAALNEGRGILNYCGHGSRTSWGTTGFSVTHINNLVNDNLLPFITSVACQNGNFSSGTCMGEAWLRATHNGEPTGAIGAYMSSVNMSWAVPYCAQKEFTRCYTEESYDRFGTLCFAGSCQMIDRYGWTGEKEFENWHVFGDPSVKVRANAGTPPRPDVKVNGEPGPLQLPAWTPIDVRLSLDPGFQKGMPSDWWVNVVRNDTDSWWWQPSAGFTLSAVPIRAYDQGLTELTDIPLVSGKIPPGTWIFSFSVDELNNSFEGTFEDSVQVVAD